MRIITNGTIASYNDYNEGKKNYRISTNDTIYAATASEKVLKKIYRRKFCNHVQVIPVLY